MSRKSSESKKERSRRDVYSARLPLKAVVAECEKRWFEATLQAAKNGEVDMQFLVGQMFCSGYGVAVDVKKGKLWLQKSADAKEEGSDDARNFLEKLSVGEAMDFTGMDSQTLRTGS